MSTASRRAVFLDRDGVIVEDVGYLRSPDQLRLLPGAGHAIGRLRDAGYLAIVVTNQSGVARGYYGEEDIRRVHAALQGLLESAGTRLDGIYYCPHHPTEGEAPYRVSCRCRKPEPGLLLQAAAEHGIDLARSVMVGDKASDVEAARRAGTRAALIWARPNHVAEGLQGSWPELQAESLSGAADAILKVSGC